jgi:hypothetical protein
MNTATINTPLKSHDIGFRQRDFSSADTIRATLCNSATRAPQSDERRIQKIQRGT